MKRFFLSLIVLMSIIGCADPEPIALAPTETSAAEKPRGDVKVVRVAAVTAVPLEIVANHPAVVRAFDTNALCFRVGGPLVDVLIENGTRVKANDVLMRIDPRDYRQDVEATQASLDAAEARLASMRCAREEDIRLLEAGIQAAAATAQYAKQELGRYRELFDKRTVSSSEFEAKQAETILAEVRLVSTQEELIKAKAGARAEDVAAMEAEIRGLRTRLQIAENCLSDTELRAPYDGIVIARLLRNHEFVSAKDKPVVRMQDISRLKIDIYVAERELIGLATYGTDASSKMEVDVVFNTCPDKRFRAKMWEMVTAPDPNTQTYCVTFVLDAPQEVTIFPGMTAEVFLSSAALVSEDKIRVLAIPSTAILGNAEGEHCVWTIDEETSTAVRTPITRGRLLPRNRYVVTHGLSEGDHVVTDGARFLAEGQKVQIEGKE